MTPGRGTLSSRRAGSSVGSRSPVVSHGSTIGEARAEFHQHVASVSAG